MSAQCIISMWMFFHTPRIHKTLPATPYVASVAFTKPLVYGKQMVYARKNSGGRNMNMSQAAWKNCHFPGT